MPFKSMAELRALQTVDVDQATAFMANNVRPGLVQKSSADAEFRFSGNYFAETDFMVGEIECGPGWSFRPEAELDAVLVWIGIDGRAKVRHGAIEGQASRDQILVTSARSTRQIVLDESFHGIVISACSDVVRSELEGYLGRRVSMPFDFLTALDSHSRSGSTMMAFASAVHTALRSGAAQDSPIGLRNFRDAFINMTLMSVGVAELARLTGPPQPGSYDDLKRAEDYMRAHADQPIGIGEIAAHIGISTRALQYMFKRVRGTTPLAALLSCRLDGVRKDLLADDGRRIADVAAKWGFTHLGRFSQQYQAAFGERPSRTAPRGRSSRTRR